MSEFVPAPELKTGDFVRIDWPNGSSLSGFVHISSNGLVTLAFGPEPEEEARWLALGFVGKMHDFVLAGSVQVIPQTESAL